MLASLVNSSMLFFWTTSPQPYPLKHGVKNEGDAFIFVHYPEHEFGVRFGVRLKVLSNLLDLHPGILSLVAKDLVNDSAAKVGRIGLSAESIFRCLLLKQQLRISYEQLAFHLSDSMTYRTFARLPNHVTPSRSATAGR